MRAILGTLNRGQEVSPSANTRTSPAQGCGATTGAPLRLRARRCSETPWAPEAVDRGRGRRLEQQGKLHSLQRSRLALEGDMHARKRELASRCPFHKSYTRIFGARHRVKLRACSRDVATSLLTIRT